MTLAYHAVFSMHGFWLPNDPRGSGSDNVRVWDLFRFGRASKVESRSSVAHMPYDHKHSAATKRELRHPVVAITGRQAVAVVSGFKTAIEEAGYQIFACAVLPNHVHLVIGAHPRPIRLIVGHLKSRGTRSIKAAKLRPADGRPLWSDHGWNIPLDTVERVRRAIRYVEENPLKDGKQRQNWSFVRPLDELEASALRATPLGREPARKLGGAALRSKLAKDRRQAN